MTLDPALLCAFEKGEKGEKKQRKREQKAYSQGGDEKSESLHLLLCAQYAVQLLQGQC